MVFKSILKVLHETGVTPVTMWNTSIVKKYSQWLIGGLNSGPCWCCHQQAARGLIGVHKIVRGFVGDNTNKGGRDIERCYSSEVFLCFCISFMKCIG
jgi:hypothetical protein